MVARQTRHNQSIPVHKMTMRFLTGFFLCLLSPSAFGFSAAELWESWPQERFVSIVAPCLYHDDLLERMQDLTSLYPDRIQQEKVGESVLGHPIQMLTLGTGPQKVLLWSQMHGDEPSATPALLDIADYLLERSDEPGPQIILESLTLLMIPMLNPDGAEVYWRRNAQGIDINRDALSLSTPEGRALKAVRDEHRPILGFNLHDQNRRTAVGDTGVLATNAVLAVAGDPEGTVTPGRLRAKRAGSAIVEALAPLVPGGMARYDEEWSPRAFGDNLTAWGTPVVLIESGGLPPGQDFSVLTRLNFVAILTVLQDLAKNDLAGYDPAVYESLLRNQADSWAEVVVRDTHILQPGSTRSFRADLAFFLLRRDRELAGCTLETDRGGSRIVEVGDARFMGAGRDLDGSGSLLLAPFEIAVDGWRARRWLNASTLSDLVRLGVGEVRWWVSRRRRIAAEALADELNRRGLVNLRVVSGKIKPSGVVLVEPPAQPDSRDLAEVLSVLGVAGPPSMEALETLWRGQLIPGGILPALRPGQPASFLVVGPAPAGKIDFNHTALRAVWHDGIEIDTNR